MREKTSDIDALIQKIEENHCTAIDFFPAQRALFALTIAPVRRLIAALKLNTSLKHLGMHDLIFVDKYSTKEWVKALRAHPNLTNLCLNNTLVFASTLPIHTLIKPQSRLRHLDLSQNFFNKHAWAKLSQALVNNPVFKTLRLRSTQMDDDALKKLIAALAHSHHLTQLDLAANQITDKGFVELIRRFIHPKSTLKKLDLSGNQITEDGLLVLAETLHKPHSLQAIHLANNAFGIPGTALLIELTRKYPAIEFTFIGKQSLAAQETLQLTQAYPNALNSLDFSNMQFSQENFHVLKMLLAQSQHLRKLSLKNTDLSEEALDEIMPFIESAGCLSALDLSGNTLSLSHAQQLLLTSQKNPLLGQIALGQISDSRLASEIEHECEVNASIPALFAKEVTDLQPTIVILMMIHHLSENSLLAALPIEALFHIFNFLDPYGVFNNSTDSFSPYAFFKAIQVDRSISQAEPPNASEAISRLPLWSKAFTQQ